MRLDPEVLARVQFGFTVTFHIIFPTMSPRAGSIPTGNRGTLA